MKEQLLPLIVVIIILAVIYLAMRIVNRKAVDRMGKRKFWRPRGRR